MLSDWACARRAKAMRIWLEMQIDQIQQMPWLEPGRLCYLKMGLMMLVDAMKMTMRLMLVYRVMRVRILLGRSLCFPERKRGVRQFETARMGSESEGWRTERVRWAWRLEILRQAIIDASFVLTWASVVLLAGRQRVSGSLEML